MRQEGTAIAGGVVGDDCGLGKTNQTLAFIYLTALMLPDDFKHHKPTIIAVPPSIIDTWLAEHSRYFSDLLDLWLCHRTVGTNLRRKGLFVAADDLPKRLAQLDPTNLTTSLTIVLASYNAFPPHARTVLSEVKGTEAEKKVIKKVRGHTTISIASHRRPLPMGMLLCMKLLIGTNCCALFSSREDATER